MSEYVLIEKTINEKDFAPQMMDALAKENVRTYAVGTGNDLETALEDARTKGCVAQDGALLCYTQELSVAAARLGIAAAAYSDEGNEDTSFEGVRYLVTSLEGIDADFFRLIRARHFGTPLHIADTERLGIREFAESDFDAFYEMLLTSPAETVENIPMESREACREWFLSYIRTKYAFYDCGYWGAFDEDGRLVGTCGVEIPESGPGGAASGATDSKGCDADDTEGTAGGAESEAANELGYMVSEAFRGKGYATELITAVVTYAREKLGLRKLICRVSAGNEASRRTIESALTKMGLPYVCRETGKGMVEYYID